MNVREALEWLHGTQWFGIKLGLENIHRLARELDADLPTARIIHVAGTNGKGSVCAMVESVARAAGYRTGLFTSPHLVRFNERIQINGTAISDEDLAEGLTRIRAIIASWDPHPTYFEIATALALCIFQKNALDVIILETGMGGRLDSTNIVESAVSVITRIDIDHAQWLGNSLGEIAAEKAGIIKRGKPVLTLPQEDEVMAVLRQTSERLDAPLLVIDHLPLEMEIELAGSHQRWNAALAIRALDAAGFSISKRDHKKGLATVSWPGRFQILEGDLVLDGAHNPAAMKRLQLTWRELFPNKKANVILGVLADKDIRQIVANIAPIVETWTTVPVRNPRSMAPDELADIVREHTAANVLTSINIADALLATPRPTLITGSLFLVGEAIALRGNGALPALTSQ